MAWFIMGVIGLAKLGIIVGIFILTVEELLYSYAVRR